MIQTITNLEKTPITGKDDFDERLAALLDNEWKLIGLDFFADYKREHMQTSVDYMTVTHITKIAMLEK